MEEGRFIMEYEVLSEKRRNTIIVILKSVKKRRLPLSCVWKSIMNMSKEETSIGIRKQEHNARWTAFPG